MRNHAQHQRILALRCGLGAEHIVCSSDGLAGATKQSLCFASRRVKPRRYDLAGAAGSRTPGDYSMTIYVPRDVSAINDRLLFALAQSARSPMSSRRWCNRGRHPKQTSGRLYRHEEEVEA